MKILAVCHWGRNRSRFVAEYLQTKGYETDFCGILAETDNQITPERVAWADKILAVEPGIADEIRSRFSLHPEKLLTINVDDKTGRPGTAGLHGDAWTEYQNTVTYPSLRDAVDHLLPIE